MRRQNINGLYDSEICEHSIFIVNDLNLATYLCHMGYKCQCEQDSNYHNPRMIWFFASSVELERCYNDYRVKNNYEF